MEDFTQKDYDEACAQLKNESDYRGWTLQRVE